ncbi:MAG TPA: transaldolase family protein, partial [Spirochaetia bacterium]|nr:transaldolase family protein [Spirochaetia bacterium]
LTATGLLGARKLREEGIPINFTLEFSARQNALVTMVAKPNYCNVFLGRLNSYVAGNNLGDGNWVGEKATIASQRIVRKLSKGHKEPTKQIAASLRNGEQLESLAGVDVYTMPTKVAREGHAELAGEFASKIDEEYHVALGSGVRDEDVHVSKLWEVSDAVLELGENLDRKPPRDGEELAVRARQMGCADLFPDLSDEDYNFLSSEGKIPKHSRWESRIKSGKLAIDTLLNIAGLASFAADQAELDSRIRTIIK